MGLGGLDSRLRVRIPVFLSDRVMVMVVGGGPHFRPSPLAARWSKDISWKGQEKRSVQTSPAPCTLFPAR